MSQIGSWNLWCTAWRKFFSLLTAPSMSNPLHTNERKRNRRDNRVPWRHPRTARASYSIKEGSAAMAGLPSRMPVAIRWGQSRKRERKRERQRQHKRKQLRLLRSRVQKNSPSHADCRAAARRQVHICMATRNVRIDKSHRGGSRKSQ